MNRHAIFITLVWAALSAISLLSGCTHVEIHVADRGDIVISHWPLGVKVVAQEGASDGVYVRTDAAALIGGSFGEAPSLWLLGREERTIYIVDDDVCSLALVHSIEGPYINKLKAHNQFNPICVGKTVPLFDDQLSE